ncbi:hypothetical protein HN814_09780 [Candidatus Woesearchaeota archaeon]|nr:hypothetical protein [Candidatus Woesearchaeota archaeon]
MDAKTKSREEELRGDIKVRELSDVLRTDSSESKFSTLNYKEKLKQLRAQAEKDMEELKEQNAKKRLKQVKTKTSNQRMHEYITFFEYAVSEKKSVEFNKAFLNQVYKKLNVSDSELNSLEKKVNKLNYKFEKYNSAGEVNVYSVGLPALIVGGVMIVAPFLAPGDTPAIRDSMLGMLIAAMPAVGVAFGASMLYPKICKNKSKKLQPKLDKYRKEFNTKKSLREKIEFDYTGENLDSIFEKVDDIDYRGIIKNIS